MDRMVVYIYVLKVSYPVVVNKRSRNTFLKGYSDTKDATSQVSCGSIILAGLLTSEKEEGSSGILVDVAEERLVLTGYTKSSWGLQLLINNWGSNDKRRSELKKRSERKAIFQLEKNWRMRTVVDFEGVNSKSRYTWLVALKPTDCWTDVWKAFLRAR